MKKILIFVLLLAGIAGAAFYYVRQFAPPAEYYADYLPADTLATATLLNLKDISSAFPESSLGKFFAKPTIRSILTEQGATEESLQKYEEFYDGAADLLTNPALQQLFGDDITFALLAPDPTRLKARFEDEQKKMLIAFGSSAAAASADSLARLTLSESFSKETVNGLELTRILLDDNEFLYGYTNNGVIILAFNPEMIAAALKQKATGGGLSRNPAFLVAKKFWTESISDPCYAKFYANPEKIGSLVASSSGTAEAKKSAAYLQGIKGISSVAVVHQGDVQIKSRADYDPANLHESLRKQHQFLRANKNLTLHGLTEKTLLYSWFSGLNDSLLSALDLRQYQAMDIAVQQQLGLSMQEIMTAIGPQAGLTMGEVVSTGLFPLPKLVLFAQIQQPEAAHRLKEKLRQKMAEQGIANERVMEVNGHLLYYWSLLPSDAAHPALVLTEKMLYLANGEAALKALLVEEGKGLPQAVRELFGPELAAQFSEANSSAFVLRPALLSIQAQKVASWAAAAFSASAKVSAERLREEIFQLMQSLDFAAGCTQTQENHTISVLVLRRKAV